MEQINRSTFMAILLALGFVFVVFFSLEHSFMTGNLLLETYADTEYAPPFDVFNENAQIFSLTPEYISASGEIVNLNVNVSLEGGYIFQKGYLYNSQTNSWEVFNFDQTPVENSYWIESFASKDLVINSSEVLVNGDNFIVAYACKKFGEVWNCGCDSADESACRKWMLQVVNVSDVILPANASCANNSDCALKNCTNGVCVVEVIPTGLCTDSDGGLNYGLFGNVSSTLNGAKTDVCVNSSYLNEAVCSGNSSNYSLNYCSYGCNSGKCKSLVWATTDEGQMMWSSALDACARKTTDGKVWRLPTVSELVAKYDETKFNTAPGFQENWYWTSDISGVNNGLTFWGVVHMGQGIISSRYDSIVEFEINVRCVSD